MDAVNLDKNVFFAQELNLKSQLITHDIHNWCLDSTVSDSCELFKYVGGVDISFVKGDDTKACAGLCVLSYPDMQVVYERCVMIDLDIPYIAGFLGFREAPHIVKLIEELKASHPHFVPDVILADGNGILHPRGFGLACHIGVLTKIPCIGVSKKLFHVDGLSKHKLAKDVKEMLEKEQKNSQKNVCLQLDLVGNSKIVLGCALLPNDSVTNPIIISVGYGVCLATAMKIVISCCKFREPEPVRHADRMTRTHIREFVQKCKYK